MKTTQHAVGAFRLISIAAVLGTAMSVYAAVTFSPATGAGFVGKGDVQTAFGWNNSTLQLNGAAVSFSFEETTNYKGICSWITGEGTRGEQPHNVPHTRKTRVRAEVVYDTRQNNQKYITGYILTGMDEETETQAKPEIGDACLGIGTNGKWTTVDVDPDSSLAGLYVTFGNQTVLIYTP